MNRSYLLRLDDACPTMHAERWVKIERILDKYGIHPMVGVIPNNEDNLQQCSPKNNSFWEIVMKWETKGWTIALHGFNHCYTSNCAGINPLWNRSEFAGLPLEEQKEKIRNGVSIFRKNGIDPKYFFAPSHTFDLNTLQALRECSNIRIISDTIATKPYKYKDFIFVPQVGGYCREMRLAGTWTFCLHPSVMNESDFQKLESFLKSHSEQFISFSDIDYSTVNSKNVGSKIFSAVYFLRRKIMRVLKK